jgi:hypothetical protein
LGAVAGVIGLVAPPIWRSFQSTPEAAIEAPTTNSTVARCFVAKGSVVASSIRRPLWLIKAEDAHGWREVGRIYPPPGTWASRVCVSSDAVWTVRLALVLADDRLDAALSRLVPEKEEEPELPDWLKRHTEQQGGRGRRHGFAPLPAGAELVTFVDVRLAHDLDRYIDLISDEYFGPPPHELGGGRWTFTSVPRSGLWRRLRR